jgi:peptidoglycan/xylan/chitin deacetylase (PgdA/CDA1 family)
MIFFSRFFYSLLFIFFILNSPAIRADNNTNIKTNIPILCYHNFNPIKPGSMNLTPKKFEAQIKWITDNGYTIIPLKEAVEYLQGKRDTLPSKPIVVTVDDGWKSAYTYLAPIVKKYNIPVTLFIYPQTISTGKNAMTWDELKELQKTGLFDIQGHTYSHPNFKQERKHRSPASYEQFVQGELTKSKQILEEKLGGQVIFLAWPFGIYDDYLENQAAKAGYVMAFTIDALPANKSDKAMAEPRYMIIDALSDKTFTNIIHQAKTVKGT